MRPAKLFHIPYSQMHAKGLAAIMTIAGFVGKARVEPKSTRKRCEENGMQFMESTKSLYLACQFVDALEDNEHRLHKQWTHLSSTPLLDTVGNRPPLLVAGELGLHLAALIHTLTGMCTQLQQTIGHINRN